MSPIATVLIPTTGDRGPVLPYSVGSVLNQTESNIEIFIIGDGVNDTTREIIAGLQQKDSRIQFFDHPKHSRRGEVYRHEALSNHAKGKIVCYLLDRDIMLPNHISSVAETLKQHNFCLNLSISVERDGSVSIMKKPVVGEGGKAMFCRSYDIRNGSFFLFSQVGHTLEFYKSLPYGWRTTPQGRATDSYMWAQFMCEDQLALKSTLNPTILYFKRGHHPGLSSKARAKELEYYFTLIHDAERVNQIVEHAWGRLVLDRYELSHNKILIRGEKPKVAAKIFRDKVIRKIKGWK